MVKNPPGRNIERKDGIHDEFQKSYLTEDGSDLGYYMRKALGRDAAANSKSRYQSAGAWPGCEKKQKAGCKM